jgi:hypothetical protein
LEVTTFRTLQRHQFELIGIRCCRTWPYCGRGGSATRRDGSWLYCRPSCTLAAFPAQTVTIRLAKTFAVAVNTILSTTIQRRKATRPSDVLVLGREIDDLYCCSEMGGLANCWGRTKYVRSQDSRKLVLAATDSRLKEGRQGNRLS